MSAEKKPPHRLEPIASWSVDAPSLLDGFQGGQEWKEIDGRLFFFVYDRWGVVEVREYDLQTGERIDNGNRD